MRASEFIDRVLSPSRSPAWWQHLQGEVDQRNVGGRWLADTIERELAEEASTYAEDSAARKLWFFGKGQDVDGTVGPLGVEHKYLKGLTWGNIVDGAIHKCIVWRLGNPHGFEAPQAVGLVVVGPGSAKAPTKPMDRDLASALFAILRALHEVGIETLIVKDTAGETPDFWRSSADPESFPGWLAESHDSARLPAASPRASDLESLRAPAAPYAPTSHGALPGKLGRFEEVPLTDGRRGARIEHNNWFQIIEFGLLLQGMRHSQGVGFDAVHARYRNPKKPLDGRVQARHVEGRVQRELWNHFGVFVDWGQPLDHGLG